MVSWSHASLWSVDTGWIMHMDENIQHFEILKFVKTENLVDKIKIPLCMVIITFCVMCLLWNYLKVNDECSNV